MKGTTGSGCTRAFRNDALGLPQPHATAARPFFATRVRSFREAPRGRFSPCSHRLTRPAVTFRWRANTAWLAFSRSRSARIVSGGVSSTGVRHISSNASMVRFAMTPAFARPYAVSCAAASSGPMSQRLTLRLPPVSSSRACPSLRESLGIPIS